MLAGLLLRHLMVSPRFAGILLRSGGILTSSGTAFLCSVGDKDSLVSLRECYCSYAPKEMSERDAFAC